MDDLMYDLVAQRKKWSAVDPVERLTLLVDIHRALGAVSELWAESCNAVYGVEADPTADGGYWLAGLFGRRLHALHHSNDLHARNRYGFCMPAGRFKECPIGHAFPTRGERAERAWLPRVSAELWFEPDGNLQGAHREINAKGCILAVVPTLETMCCPVDVLHALFVDSAVVILILQPSLCPPAHVALYKKVFAPAVARKVMVIVETDTPSAVLRHPSVMGHVFIGHTSSQFYDLYWGTSSNTTLPTTSVDRHLSVLGGVPPWVVVPYKYSDRQLKAIAWHLAVSKLRCGGRLHHSPQLVMTASEWPQRDAFWRHVTEGLKSIRKGHNKRCEVVDVGKFRASPCREVVEVDGVVILKGVVPGSDATRREVRAMALAEVVIPTGDWRVFMGAAREILNGDKVMGSTCVTMVAPPDFLKVYEYDAMAWVHGINYGTVSVNTDASLALWIPVLPWGSLPGHKDDIRVPQSGSGRMGNTYSFNGVRKAVVRSPLCWPYSPTSGRTLLQMRLSHYMCGGPNVVWRTVPVVSAAFLRF